MKVQLAPGAWIADTNGLIAIDERYAMNFLTQAEAAAALATMRKILPYPNAEFQEKVHGIL